jgi:hypothetical protein
MPVAVNVRDRSRTSQRGTVKTSERPDVDHRFRPFRQVFLQRRSGMRSRSDPVDCRGGWLPCVGTARGFYLTTAIAMTAIAAMKDRL